MKKFALAALALAALAAPGVRAEDIHIVASMQRCTADDQCTLAVANCNEPCANVPVHKAHMQTLGKAYNQRCGGSMQTAQCSSPALDPACINGRCTIDYAYRHHGSAGDYAKGGWGAAAAGGNAPVYSGTSDYSDIDDRDGNFTAYDLPQNTVTQGTLGR